jgi:DNA-binding transcriptional LysR family regulator
MDRLTGISTFVKVVELAGFSAAAKQLCVSAAVVSTRIQLLENRLGARLLNRTTRSVSPTEAGKAYYEHCLLLLSEIEEAEQLVQSLHSSPRGTLRLSVSISIEHLISALICKFSRTHPELSFETIISEELRDLVGEGFDLAIRIGPLPDSTLIARCLGVCNLVLCASPEYLAAKGVPQSLENISAHTCLTYTRYGPCKEWLFERHGEARKLDVSASFAANSTGALRAAVLAGQGIALLPECSVRNDLGTGALTRILPDYRPAQQTVYAVLPPGRRPPAKARCFVDFLADQFRQEDVQNLILPPELTSLPSYQIAATANGGASP